MRKLSAILFLLLLVSTTEPGIQLFKLPLLFSHFQMHIAEGRGKSFTGFLKEHYAGSRHTDHDSQQDNQLPFKATSQEAFAGLYITSSLSEVSPDYSIHTSYLLPIYQFSLQDYMEGIFHPPKPVA